MVQRQTNRQTDTLTDTQGEVLTQPSCRMGWVKIKTVKNRNIQILLDMYMSVHAVVSQAWRGTGILESLRNPQHTGQDSTLHPGFTADTL